MRKAPYAREDVELCSTRRTNLRALPVTCRLLPELTADRGYDIHSKMQVNLNSGAPSNTSDQMAASLTTVPQCCSHRCCDRYECWLTPARAPNRKQVIKAQAPCPGHIPR